MNTPTESAAVDRLRRRAMTYVSNRQWEAAQAALEALLQRSPSDIHAHIELASVLLQRGQLRASTELLLQVSRMPLADSRLILDLVRRLYFSGEIVAARACLESPALANRPVASALAAQAQLRWLLGEMPPALALVERAIAAGADAPDVHYLHGMLLQYTGNIDRATEVLAGCVGRWPRFGDAAVALASLRRQTADDNHLELLRQRLAAIPADSTAQVDRFARAGFESALFKELDDLGRPDEAWPALERSNALMHALNRYDAAGEAAVTDALIRTSEVLGPTLDGKSSSFEGPIPIFIVGMPRSGTTLLDRMLSSHSHVTSAGEINDFRRQLRWMTDVPAGGVPGMLRALERAPGIDFAELGARYLRQTQWRAQGRTHYVDKLPINVRMVPLIRRALPHAPILHMVREPMDVCFSNFKAMLGHGSAYSYDMQALAHYYRQYARLTDHWHATLPGTMLDVSYAQLVNDTEATLRTVLAHCGLDLEEGCLHPERNPAPVATPSSAQVREPVYARSLGEWRRYATALEPLRQALG